MGTIKGLGALSGRRPGLTKTSTIARLFAAISVNEMDGQVFHCEDAELIPFLGDSLLNVPAPLGFNNKNYSFFKS